MPFFLLDTCDLNFVVGEKGLSGHTLSKNGMAYMWGGAFIERSLLFN